ncbi:MAG: bifunctional phosphopantothenoylcysteine decarboxylase/phosphopantothenate--cysteine ligase CoaBC [Limnochordia bacterium]|jgi:phosphopantothenoylcysteine decarboxylase/phosphopantothenate--cysteine ligase|nr:bifunctional phosphopantothenoylcysteine decarboxylase/phosphopantothenate--cysteine ligase CoaBC [Limnochordia bacterium]MDD4518451.1 bifunctional phosphopantothenoylcysteine decarboxylase/phosphopantothenate--cysteine ligase CoaBC [Limnochordia bacterium]
MQGKRVVLGITGSIAAYKGAQICSDLVKAGAIVDVIMTKAAMEFIGPLTLQNIANSKVHTDMFALPDNYDVEHISLAQSADLVLIAPATANCLAKLASGLADDLLTCTVLASKAPVVIAPAMNTNMYLNSITQENIQRLKDRGMRFVEPASGRLACGMIGQGRLASVDLIVDTVRLVLGDAGDLAGKKIVVTGGGNREPIDPVRFIGNRSSGKTGVYIAREARDRGAQVVLISGPTELTPPVGVEFVGVETALEMLAAVQEHTKSCDALIMSAAVADYRVENAALSKQKKQERLTIDLVQNPDILASTNGDFIKIGFAAETENLLPAMKEKILKKNLDLIVGNLVGQPGRGFESETNQVVIMDREGTTEHWPMMEKERMATKILDRLQNLLAEK